MREESEFIDLLTLDPQTALEFGIPVDEIKAIVLLYCLPPEQIKPAPIEDTFSLPSVHFARQFIENSCALMAILHILMNRSELWHHDKFGLKNAIELQPVEAGNLIKDCSQLAQLHAKFASCGQSDQIDETSFHFVTILPESDGLVILDGRRAGPIRIPNSEPFFAAACSAIQEHFMTSSELSALALI